MREGGREREGGGGREGGGREGDELLVYPFRTQGYSHLSGIEMTSLLKRCFQSRAVLFNLLWMGGSGCFGSPFIHSSIT